MSVSLVLLPRLSKYFCRMEQLWPGVFLINHCTELGNIFVAFQSYITPLVVSPSILTFPPSFICLIFLKGFQTY